MEEPLELIRRAEELLQLGEDAPEEARIVLYAAALEAVVAAILLTSSTRRSKKLCSVSTRRLVNMALLELRRANLVTQEELEDMKRTLQALRCQRNRLAHPWPCNTEKCRNLDLEDAKNKLKALIEATKQLTSVRAKQ